MRKRRQPNREDVVASSGTSGRAKKKVSTTRKKTASRTKASSSKSAKSTKTAKTTRSSKATSETAAPGRDESKTAAKAAPAPSEAPSAATAIPVRVVDAPSSGDAPAVRPEARAAVLRGVAIGMGLGTVPFPAADIAALAGVQMDVLDRLAHIYGVTPPDKRLVMELLVLSAGVLSEATGWMTLGTVAKFLPGAGMLLGSAVQPVAFGALSYALGMSAAEHLEAGRPFATLGHQTVRSTLSAHYRRGRSIASSLTRRGRAKQA